jgi:class 3 adenylate cyclase
MYTLRRHILFATGAAAVLLTAFALWSARAFVRPIIRLERGVDRLKSGEDDFRIEESGRDEFALLAAAFNSMIAEVHERNRTIEEKTAEYEDLLRNVFPEAVANRVSGGDLMVADTFPNVSVGYLSIEGLEQLMDGLDAAQTLGLLNELVDAFDDAAERHGVEKIRTVGDAYLATCGLSTPRLDHRQRMSAFATETVSIVERFNQAKGCNLSLQIGLASGEVDAGVVGRRRFVYEILGRCVADARRLANSADTPGIRTTAEFAAASSGRAED